MIVEKIATAEQELRNLFTACINYMLIMRDTQVGASEEREKALAQIEKTLPLIKRNLWLIKNLRQP